MLDKIMGKKNFANPIAEKNIQTRFSDVLVILDK